MTRSWTMLVLMLAACGSQPAGNDAANATAPAPTAVVAPSDQACVLPKLDFRAAEGLGAKDQARFAENFRKAFDEACAENMFAKEPLIDPQAVDKSTLFVMNAPEANVTSIYFGPSAAPPAMLLESPFKTPDGALHLPSVEDLHEAMYCAMVGATEKEQEESGRCLPD